jgi:hypothetical protein
MACHIADDRQDRCRIDQLRLAIALGCRSTLEEQTPDLVTARNEMLATATRRY